MNVYFSVFCFPFLGGGGVLSNKLYKLLSAKLGQLLEPLSNISLIHAYMYTNDACNFIFTHQ